MLSHKNTEATNPRLVLAATMGTNFMASRLSTEKHALPSDIDTWAQRQKVKVRVLAVRTALLPGKWSGYRKKPNGLFWCTEKLLDLTLGVGYTGFMYVRPSL